MLDFVSTFSRSAFQLLHPFSINKRLLRSDDDSSLRLCAFAIVQTATTMAAFMHRSVSNEKKKSFLIFFLLWRVAGYMDFNASILKRNKRFFFSFPFLPTSSEQKFNGRFRPKNVNTWWFPPTDCVGQAGRIVLTFFFLKEACHFCKCTHHFGNCMYVMGLLCIFMCITGSPVKYIKIWSYKSATALPPLSHMEHQRIPPSLYDVIVHDDERYRGT